MKNLFFIILLIASNAMLLAQAPGIFNYQAVARDSNGNVLINEQVNLTVGILSDSISGSEVYSETHQCTTNEIGLVTLNIGSKNQSEFSSIPWNTGVYFLKISLGEELLGISQLMSVPYALHANTADTVLGKTPPFVSGDSLVLKDQSGMTRFVINPNTGTLKMMDNDTVWYKLSVNSPPKVRMVNEDGSYLYADASGNDIEVYRSDGTLKHTIKKEETTYKEWETVVDYNNNEVKVKEVKTEHEFEGGVSGDFIVTKTFRDDGSISTEERKNVVRELVFGKYQTTTIQSIIIYDSNGTIISESVKEWKNGTLVSDVSKENGVEVKSLSQSETVLPPGMGAQRIINSNKSVYSLEGILIDKITKTKGYSVDGNDPDGSYEIENHTVKKGNDTYTVGVTMVDGKTTQITNIKNGEFTEKKSISITGRVTEEKTEFYNNGSNDFTTVYTVDPDGKLIEWKAKNTTGNSSSLRIEPESLTIYGDQNITGNSTITGDQTITGNLNVNGTKNFRIDHPLDPENKFLVHAAIESNEVLNKYSGNVVTDKKGVAIVELPDYFEKINTDFRYQLTVIGEFAQAIIAKEVHQNHFEIHTNKPRVKVSWEITARRTDQYLRENPFLQEVSK